MIVNILRPIFPRKLLFFVHLTVKDSLYLFLLPVDKCQTIPEITASHQELLKEDLAAEEIKTKQAGIKAKGEVTLGVTQPQAKRPRLLGPILDARFPKEKGGSSPPGIMDRVEQSRVKVKSGYEGGVALCNSTLKKPRISADNHQRRSGEVQPDFQNNKEPGEMQPGPRGSSSSM